MKTLKKQNVTGVNFTNAELLARVKAAAQADGRSFSSYVCRVLERGLAEPVGTLKDVPAAEPTKAQETPVSYLATKAAAARKQKIVDARGTGHGSAPGGSGSPAHPPTSSPRPRKGRLPVHEPQA